MRSKDGFTIIELVITMTIFVLISSLILANYNKFSQRSALSRTAQEITLALRKAQSFSLAVRGFPGGSGTQFSAWGVHFEKNANYLSNPATQYAIYSDTSPANKKYDGAVSPNNELFQLFQIQNSSRIVNICSGLKTTNPSCSNPPAWVDIIYQRPNPNITLNSAGLLNSYSDITIIVQSPDGVQRKVIIWNTGQVTVE